MKVIFNAIMPNISWFQLSNELFECFIYFILFFVIAHPMVGQNKQREGVTVGSGLFYFIQHFSLFSIFFTNQTIHH